jgi:hypothetical protein
LRTSSPSTGIYEAFAAELLPPDEPLPEEEPPEEEPPPDDEDDEEEEPLSEELEELDGVEVVEEPVDSEEPDEVEEAAVLRLSVL